MTDPSGPPDDPESTENAQFLAALRAALQSPSPSGMDPAQVSSEVQSMIRLAWTEGVPPSAGEDGASHHEARPAEVLGGDDRGRPTISPLGRDDHDLFGSGLGTDHTATEHHPPDDLDHGPTPHL